jgi:hypothetical protein
VTDIHEFTAEVVTFGYPSHNCASFDPALICIVQCEHDFDLIADVELVSGWNNESNPAAGDVSYEHVGEAFGCGERAVLASDMNFFDRAVVTFAVKVSAGVLSIFKKNGKTALAFTP